MTSIIVCGFFGVLFGMLFSIFWMMVWTSVNTDIGERLCILGATLTVIVMTVGGALIGRFMAYCDGGEWVVSYQAAKTTIESSLENEVLSGLERLDLVKQAVELNKELAANQYAAGQWYGFYIPDSVHELEPITFESDKN